MKKLALYLTLAALGIGGATATYEILKPEPKQEIKQEKTLENITFEQAKLNSSLRQQYLDQILANKDKFGITNWDYLWDSFERLVYDPNFESLKDTKIPKEAGAVTILNTEQKGKKSLSYFNNRCFEASKSEDDLLSLIDHESVHAYFCETHKFPQYILLRSANYKQTGKETDKVKLLAQEMIAYDLQLAHILSSKRKTSEETSKECKKNYLEYYTQLLKISEQNNEDSAYTKVILGALLIKINSTQKK